MRMISEQQIAGDAAWLAHRYDAVADSFHFVHAPRAIHRQATFLTDEFLPDAARPRVIGRATAVAAAGAGAGAAPAHFIFHSAYCCSTLLARAFDVEGRAMALKEPVLLNDLSGLKRRGTPPRQVAMLLDQSMRLLERPFAPGETVVIKPSNVVNVLAPAMLAMRPGARALLLYAPLPVYLGSIARKGMWGRLWVRELLTKQLQDGLVDLGFAGEDYLRQTDLQAAAVGWLAQHALFARLVRQFGPERVRTLDSETLLARPRESLAALVALYGLGWDGEAVDAVAAGPAFTRHSKLDQGYDAGARKDEQAAAASAHAEEIGMVIAWAQEVAARRGLSFDPGAPLLAA